MNQGVGKRIGAAAVLVPVVVVLIWLGGWAYMALLALTGAIVAFEWCAMVFAGGRLQTVVHVGAAVLAALAAPVIGLAWLSVVLALFWLASLIAAVRGARPLKPVWWFAGFPYIIAAIVALVLLRADADNGFFATLWLFVAVWLADTLAFVFGRGLGGAKLMPAVSPNKTWAGLLGAVIGASAGSILIGWFGGYAQLAILAGLGAVFGAIEQGGDLLQSAAKRAHGVKDSGKLIPGHGGVFDRVDGLLAAGLAAAAIGASRGGADHIASGLVVW